MPLQALASPPDDSPAVTIPEAHEALQDRAVPLAPTPMADLPRRPATRPDRPTPAPGPGPLPRDLPLGQDPRLDRRASAAGESSIIRFRRYPPGGGE
jgi:hypothetical protein